MGALKAAHGGELKNLYLGAEEAEEEKARSREIKSWDLTPRQLCDIELILNGGFSPLEVYEARDRKGLYARARAGVITEFTGVSDPYEEPENPEMRIDTTEITIDQAAQQVLLKLESLGYLS
ncbi:MAG: adenylyl-sulfate kinase [Novosphingobium sp.]|nr:adenylyl-sulfate kinase [Novosphingobium sp.]